MTPYRLGIEIGTKGGSSAPNSFRRMGQSIRGIRQGANAGAQGVSKLANAWQNARGRLSDAEGRFLGMGRTLEQSGQSARRFGRGVEGTTVGVQRLGTATKGVLGHVSSLGGALLATGAALAGGALFQGLIGTNIQLENQKLGMAALISANLEFRDSNGKLLNSQKSLDAAMQISGNLINQYRKDALKGAGTSEERILITNSTINSALSAGKGLQDVRGLANEVVSVSKLVPQLMNDASQAARDASLILSGNAGSEVSLFSFLKAQLGDAETWNKLDPTKRFERFRKALQTFATADLIAAQANSWQGLTSSLADFRDITLATLGGPLFGKMKLGLKGMVDALVDEKGEPTKLAQRISNTVAAAGDGIAKGLEAYAKVGALTLQTYAQVWGEFAKGAKPVVVYFLGKFEELRKIGGAWLKDNQPLVNDAITGFRALGRGLFWVAKQVGAVTAGALGFIGLGLATVLGGIAIGLAHAGRGMKTMRDTFVKNGGGVQGVLSVISLGLTGLQKTGIPVLSQVAGATNWLVTGAARVHKEWLKAGGGINGAIKLLGQGFNWLRAQALNTFDRMLIGLVRFARDTIANIKATPFLGSLLGWSGATSGTEEWLANQQAFLEGRIRARNAELTGQPSKPPVVKPPAPASNKPVTPPANFKPQPAAVKPVLPPTPKPIFPTPSKPLVLAPNMVPAYTPMKPVSAATAPVLPPANPANARVSQGAAKLAQSLNTVNVGGTTLTQTNQFTITNPDPQAAGAAAARQVTTATKAVLPDPSRRGLPLLQEYLK